MSPSTHRSLSLPNAAGSLLTTQKVVPISVEALEAKGQVLAGEMQSRFAAGRTPTASAGSRDGAVESAIRLALFPVPAYVPNPRERTICLINLGGGEPQFETSFRKIGRNRGGFESARLRAPS